MAAEGKKRKMYFQPKMDIALLLEVLQHNPYRHGNAVYGTITALLRQREVFRDVERRTLQDRVERLLKLFRSEQLAGMKRSGMEEEYDKRERLLQEISDLEKEWASRKREAATTATEVRKKAARMNAVGRPMLMQLATPLRPVVTPPGNDEEAVEVPEPEVDDTNGNPPGPQEVGQNVSHQPLPQGRPPRKSSSSPAARWSSTLSYMEEKMKKEEESKKAVLDVQREELQLKKDELEVRKQEVANERLRIEGQVREQQRVANVEEERRKEEREERKLMMERQNDERKEMMHRQNKLMDAMLQLVQATKK